MRKSRQVTLTLLATAAMTSMPCYAEWPQASAGRQIVTADALAGFVERGGFGEDIASWWPLLLIAPFLAAVFIRFSGGE